jgi:RHS repeat-associated protein
VGRETFSYDGAGNLNELTRVVEASSGRKLEQHFEYDDFGNLTSHRVEGVEVGVANGPVVQSMTQPLVTQFEYDEYYRVKATILPSGEREEDGFDHAGRLIDVKLLADQREIYHVEYDYDGNGNLKTRQEHGSRTSLTYYGDDRVKDHTSPADATTSFTYDENGNPLTIELNSGLLGSLKLDNYDDLDRPQDITHSTQTLPSSTHVTYPPGQRKVVMDDSLGASTSYEAKQVGREWSETGPLGTADLTIDHAGREVTETITDVLGSSPTRIHFTEFGDVDKITDATLKEYDFSPEVDGRVLESRLPTSQGSSDAFKNTYSLDGLLLSSSRPDGQTLVMQYDLRGNVVQEAVRFPNGDIKGTTYNYDAAGRMTKVFGADGAVDEVIDANGDGLPDFNEFGQPTAIRLARGIPVSLGYDAIGRLKTLQYLTNFISHAYDSLNRLTEVSNANGSIGFQYGVDGLIRWVGVSQFGTNWVMPQHYNTEGARVDLQYPDGTVVILGRDPVGRLTSVLPGGVAAVVQTNIFGAGALITDRTLGDGLIDLHIDYDGNRRETNRTYRLHFSKALLAAVAYLRNDAGLIIRRQLTHAGTADYFDYDGSQRLTNAVIGVTNGPVSEPSIIPPGAYGRAFQYSPTDVLTNSALRNPQLISLPAFVESVSNVDNTLFASNVTFSGALNVVRGRDAAGNTTNGIAFARLKAQVLATGAPGDAFTTVNITNTTYNELDQLVLVQRDDGVTVANTYGPNGLRIRRTVQGPVALGINSDLEYIYDGINLIEILDFTRSREVRARFYYGDNGDELLAGDFFDPGSSSPKRFYYLTDSLGSPMALVSASGNVVEYYMYDAWGEVTIRPPGGGGPGSLAPGALGIHTRSNVGSPFYFQGQVYDEDAGLIYMRARFYDPALGAFLQRDPSGYEDSGNQYAGLAGDPINRRDPRGLGIFDPPSTSGEDFWTYQAHDAELELVHQSRQLLNMVGIGFLVGGPNEQSDYFQAKMVHTSGHFDDALRVGTGDYFGSGQYVDIHRESRQIGSPAAEEAGVLLGNALGFNQAASAVTGESRSGQTLNWWERGLSGLEGAVRIVTTIQAVRAGVNSMLPNKISGRVAYWNTPEGVRPIVVVEGEAWYRSTGTSGGSKAGEWVKLHGVSKIRNIMTGARKQWVIKSPGKKVPEVDVPRSRALERWWTNRRVPAPKKTIPERGIKRINHWLRKQGVNVDEGYYKVGDFPFGGPPWVIDEIP